MAQAPGTALKAAILLAECGVLEQVVTLEFQFSLAVKWAKGKV